MGHSRTAESASSTRGSVADVLKGLAQNGQRVKVNESNFSYRLVTFAHRFVSEEPCRQRRFIAPSADGIAVLDATDVGLLFPMSTDGCIVIDHRRGEKNDIVSEPLVLVHSELARWRCVVAASTTRSRSFPTCPESTRPYF